MNSLFLLRQKKFAPLFWTQFFGAFNDNFLKNSLVILVTFHSMSIWGLAPAEIVALAGGIFILPFFLFSAIAGQLADKYEKSEIIYWIKLIEIGIMIAAAIGFCFHRPEFLLFVLFAMGLHSTFFGPIKYSILPQHLETSELVTGNALVEAGTFTAILLGTIAGGELIAREGGEAWVSMGLIAVALAGFLTCRRIPPAPSVTPELPLEWNPIGPTFRIFSFTRKPEAVFSSIVAISWFWFVGAVMLSIFPSLCKDVLGGDAHLVTRFLALFSIGIATGSMLTGRLSKGQLNLQFVAAGFLGLSVFSLALWFLSAHSGNWILIGAALFLFSVFGGFFIVPLYTLMQERSALENRSRVIAANNILNAAFMVLASVILLALLHFHVTIPQVILLVAIGNFLMWLWMCRKMPELKTATMRFFRLRSRV